MYPTFASRLHVFGAWSLLFLVASVNGMVLEPKQPSRPTPRAAAASATVTANQAQLRLNPNWDYNANPQTRTFYWTISTMNGGPDGYQRPMTVVNGQFPGPLIEANTGDTIVVNVQNNLDEGTTVHWHGVNQNGTAFMDGLVGINQCPIPPGGSFTYQFTIEQQWGTFWWHSHYSLQYTDGVQGPLVVHSPNEPYQIGYDYDYDQIIVLDDWWHDNASYIFNQILTNPTGYDGHGNASPSPDSALINGVGVYACGGTCTQPAPLEIEVIPGKKYRFRLINTGSHLMQRFSIDGHTLPIIEADDSPVSGPTVDRVPIHNGERYSVIVDANVGQNGDAYWIRSALVTSCLAWVAADLTPTALAVLRYVSEGSTPTTALPTSTDWSDPSNGGTCLDLDPNTLPPINAPQVASRSSQSFVFNFQLNAQNIFEVNDITFTNHPYEALLYSLLNGNPLDTSNVATITIEDIEMVDLIINNLDTVLDHPIHMHGRRFWIVASGTGTMSTTGTSSVKFNTNNPLYRDTTVVPRSSWVILRLLTDTPGINGIHCHIAWHLADGFLGAVIIQPQTLINDWAPRAWMNQCTDGSTGTTIPGKREDVQPRLLSEAGPLMLSS